MLKVSVKFLISCWFLASSAHHILAQNPTTPSKDTNPTTPNMASWQPWFIAGPTSENENDLALIIKKEKVVRVTALDNPVGEIELNVMITPTGKNEGPPTNLPDDSDFVEITYKSSHVTYLQAREGDNSGKACTHGGSHPRVQLPASPNNFTTVKLYWSMFRTNGRPDGKLLNINNLCKFNFVNYKPVKGATLEVRSIHIDQYAI